MQDRQFSGGKKGNQGTCVPDLHRAFSIEVETPQNVIWPDPEGSSETGTILLTYGEWRKEKGTKIEWNDTGANGKECRFLLFNEIMGGKENGKIHRRRVRENHKDRKKRSVLRHYATRVEPGSKKFKAVPSISPLLLP